MLRLLTSILILALATAAHAQAVLGGVNDINNPQRPPVNSIGNDSQWYIDFLTGNVFGPKLLGQWPITPTTIFATTSNTLAHVPNNAALQAVVPTAGAIYVRDGFYAAGDGGQASYVGSTTNCPTPDNGAQVQPSGTGCWIANFQGRALAAQFGASPSASAAANVTALQAWLNVASATLELDIAGGTYNINAGLVLPAVDNESVVGVGGSVVFNYAGSTATTHVFTAGSASGLTKGVRLENLRTTSSLAMTGTAGVGGTGFYFQNLSQPRLHNIFGGNADLDANRNLYNGIVFAGAHTAYLDGWSAYGSNDCLQIYATSYGNSDLWAENGNAYICGVNGIHVAGGFGGFYLDTTNIFKATTNNILIDEQITSTSNEQVFIGPLVSNDGNFTTTNLVNINDAGTTVANVNLSGYMGGFGSYAVNVQNWGTSGNYGRVNIIGANILNNGTGTGVYVQDQYTAVAIDGATQISNVAIGVDATHSTNNIQGLPQFLFNTTNSTVNARVGNVAFTPTLGCFSGGGSVGASAITASITYGPNATAVVNANIVLGTITGTCNQLTLSLPVTSGASQFVGSALDATSFVSEATLVQSAATQVIVFGTAVSGHTIIVGPITVQTQ